MVVPVPKAKLRQAIREDPKYLLDNLNLLDVPSSDASLFPNGFPEGFHPVIASSGFLSDIRLSLLQLDGPLQFNLITVPYVSKGTSTAAVAAPLNGYISGTSAQALEQFAGLVPSVASGTAFGIDLRFGLFEPRDAAYQADGPNQFSINAKWNTVPNPLSGPGVYIEALDLAFGTTSAPKYTLKALKEMINQPLLTAGPLRLIGDCLRMTYFLTNATAGVQLRNGNATFGPGASGVNLLSSALQRSSADGASGVFTDVDGLSGCAQTVATLPESCEAARQNLDPAAL